MIQTCATFRYLDFVHLHALNSKGSTLAFYQMMERLDDNSGLAPPIWRYPALKLMLSQWRHLHMLKRGGRGHDPSPRCVEDTKSAELAIKCPSCPRPGINLPNNYLEAPPEDRFLYRAILAMDANFRLKNQLVSSWTRDAGMGIGCAYFVERAGYKKYIKSRMHEEDISTCVGFAALAKAATKYSRGLRYTGVGAVSCARTDMITAVGNLEKGERYGNMDYTFALALREFVDVDDILISYDIACQWFANLESRISKFWPQELKPPVTFTAKPAIPKFHLPSHEDDHEEYSFNIIPGVGSTDGEGPERIWSFHNPLAASTKPMAPATRLLVLDDNFGFWNWMKYTGHGK
ncbi:hypothetical protein BT96DRAFT_955974 [Gymnopus androsaceus JB14]|uniref:CxC2-like cysteine cluster KDZ transposase-associated domain-containing protein n=1 Tax=Gymnopus androsaceus JB14 TaxID=1447944 RepID=A0A6A4I1J2_9AGAR|nr:hypothetical protein BT96DRAFT_955974 [Gymnopus androsaceus JB14]